MADEAVLIALVKQYANKYGITFNSKHLDDAEKKAQLIRLMQASIAGKRGPITNDDLR